MMWQLHHQFVVHGKDIQLLNAAKHVAIACNTVVHSHPMWLLHALLPFALCFEHLYLCLQIWIYGIAFDAT